MAAPTTPKQVDQKQNEKQDKKSGKNGKPEQFEQKAFEQKATVRQQQTAVQEPMTKPGQSNKPGAYEKTGSAGKPYTRDDTVLAPDTHSNNQMAGNGPSQSVRPDSSPISMLRSNRLPSGETSMRPSPLRGRA